MEKIVDSLPQISVRSKAFNGCSSQSEHTASLVNSGGAEFSHRISNFSDFDGKRDWQNLKKFCSGRIPVLYKTVKLINLSQRHR